VSTLLSDSNAGNHFAVANNALWIATYDLLSKFNLIATRSSQTMATSSSGQFQLKPIPNQVVTFPRAVLIPLETIGARPGQVRFQIESEVDNAEIRGHGFYWQPGLNQTGLNRFTVNAISTSGQTVRQTFTIDVRSFNAPPRFNPTRPITITVGENFTLPVKAIDTDGIDQDLIRYHGVDLPEGSSISERTGMFSWTPDRRQVGDHEFRVIATDQFGAATSQTISITVRNLTRN
jgi:nitric oxide reductase large subunit